MEQVQSFLPESREYAGEEAIKAYLEDGVVCLREAFDTRWLQIIESGVKEYFDQTAGENDSANVTVAHDGDSGNFYYASLMWKRMAPFKKVVLESHAVDLFGSFLESETVNFYYDFLLGILSCRYRASCTIS